MQVRIVASQAAFLLKRAHFQRTSRPRIHQPRPSTATTAPCTRLYPSPIPLTPLILHRTHPILVHPSSKPWRPRPKGGTQQRQVIALPPSPLPTQWIRSGTMQYLISSSISICLSQPIHPTRSSCHPVMHPKRSQISLHQSRRLSVRLPSTPRRPRRTTKSPRNSPSLITPRRRSSLLLPTTTQKLL